MARLVDTSVFIELERRKLQLIDLDIVVQGDSIALESITASDLLVGAYRSGLASQRIRRLNFAESVLRQVPILPFDETTARTHARLTAELALTGQIIGSHDMIIAATAITSGYILLTHDLNHFQRVPGLEIDEPSW
jgi:tRNA(fMet)-specific endonuclease VapC